MKTHITPMKQHVAEMDAANNRIRVLSAPNTKLGGILNCGRVREQVEVLVKLLIPAIRHLGRPVRQLKTEEKGRKWKKKRCQHRGGIVGAGMAWWARS